MASTSQITITITSPKETEYVLDSCGSFVKTTSHSGFWVEQQDFLKMVEPSSEEIIDRVLMEYRPPYQENDTDADADDEEEMSEEEIWWEKYGDF